jgi:hypothetical protein
MHAAQPAQNETCKRPVRPGQNPTRRLARPITLPHAKMHKGPRETSKLFCPKREASPRTRLYKSLLKRSLSSLREPLPNTHQQGRGAGRPRQPRRGRGGSPRVRPHPMQATTTGARGPARLAACPAGGCTAATADRERG